MDMNNVVCVESQVIDKFSTRKPILFGTHVLVGSALGTS